jgi:hypothetical protein
MIYGSSVFRYTNFNRILLRTQDGTRCLAMDEELDNTSGILVNGETDLVDCMQLLAVERGGKIGQ